MKVTPQFSTPVVERVVLDLTKDEASSLYFMLGSVDTWSFSPRENGLLPQFRTFILDAIGGKASEPAYMAVVRSHLPKRKIMAIKEYRSGRQSEGFECGPKEAKDFVEAMPEYNTPQDTTSAF